MLDTRTLKSAIGRVAGSAGAYARAFNSTMMVVAFHRVNDQMPDDELTCSTAKFEAFCRFFQRNTKIVPFSEQVAACHEGKDMRRTLSLTFDDGYRDNFDVVAPILQRLQIPATFFITTGFIGSQTTAPWDVALPQQPGWMTWDQVRILVARGFEVGPHTHTHIDMGSMDLETIRAELEISNAIFKRELGYDPQLFAYPFGGRQHISERSRALVRELGLTCCASCYGGVNAVGCSPYHLQRIPVGQWFSTPDQFGFEFVMGLALRRI